jgi:hypothetical protein
LVRRAFLLERVLMACWSRRLKQLGLGLPQEWVTAQESVSGLVLASGQEQPVAFRRLAGHTLLRPPFADHFLGSLLNLLSQNQPH